MCQSMPAEEVEVVPGVEGIIGKGALGEVRKGSFKGLEKSAKGVSKACPSP